MGPKGNYWFILRTAKEHINIPGGRIAALSIRIA